MLSKDQNRLMTEQTGSAPQSRQELNLSQDEVDRLLPLVRRVGTHISEAGRMGRAEAHPPTELSDSLRKMLHAIAASHGFEKVRVEWAFKANSVRVWVALPPTG
jgi:hypothetical protein